MQNNNRLTFISVLMVLTLLVVTLFLGIWLKSSYRQEKEYLGKDLKTQYNDLVQQYATEHLKKQIKAYIEQNSQNKAAVAKEKSRPLIPEITKIQQALQQLNEQHLPKLIDHADSITIKQEYTVLQQDSGQIQYYSSIEEAPDSIQKILRDQVSALSSPNRNYTLISDQHAGKQKTGNPKPVTVRQTIHTNSALAQKDTTGLHQALSEMGNIMEDLNLLNGIDSVNLYKDLVKNIALRFKGLRVFKTPKDSNDLIIKDDNANVLFPGIVYYVSHYEPYLRTRLHTQFAFSIFLLLLCAATLFVSYRTLVTQQRLTIQKNDFISNTTHELKTPITTAQLALEAFNHFDIKENIAQTKEYITIASDELKRLESFVLDVLNQLHLDQGIIRFHKTSIRLGHLIDQVIGRYQSSISLQNKQLIIDQPIPELELSGDRIHLENAIGNIVDNAIKYGDQYIHLRAYVAGNMLTIIIDDDGMGIAAKERKKVFEKFYRIQTDKGHLVKGHGLGLSYAQKVITAHKGHISIADAPDGGASFIITLPLNKT
ncbi:hypothetical protein DBR32_06120 [Taibaiella sp. KBW10]|uniref:sensor histidine kinase n=1 Tax=Taibaiella sp. KBW10 TaxID=2153357 RepID=UPI000F5AF0EF|nr:HAMP domain-containing sensor histidine kinase [Taibaiella sp. KBW10]RQO31530.1 hypothetical protein DBR32_06120 [Taibaiella sp. KBW10]